MKIEIEFDNSYQAKLVIDGRQMTVEAKPGAVSLEGIEYPDADETLGGIIASNLFDKIAEFQQAWAVVQEEQPGAGTWDRLKDGCLECVNDALW